MIEFFIFEGMNMDKTIDYAITFNGIEYIVDIFNADIFDATNTYIETFTYDDIEIAKRDMICPRFDGHLST